MLTLPTAEGRWHEHPEPTGHGAPGLTLGTGKEETAGYAGKPLPKHIHIYAYIYTYAPPPLFLPLTSLGIQDICMRHLLVFQAREADSFHKACVSATDWNGLFILSLLMPQRADRWAAISQHRKNLVGPFAQQWIRPLQDKLETSRPNYCCFNITGKFFACVATVSHIHHRRGSTSKALK